MAVVLELLLPNSSLQRYVRMVVGLLLLLALLKPVLSVFDVNPEDMFNKFSESSTVNDGEIKNSIENKKSEIQASNHAYIEEQMAVQLQKEMKKEVADHFHLAIKKTRVKLDKNTSGESREAISHIDVVLGEQDESGDEKVDPVESVTIDTASREDVDESKDTDSKKNKVRSFLAEKWGLSPKKITITLEGGEAPDDDR